MNSFGRYIARHLAAFAGMLLGLLLVNGAVFCSMFYRTVARDYGPSSPTALLELAGTAATPEGLSPEAAQALRQTGVWAMYLSPEGKSLWSLDKPENVPERYTLQDVARFTRGYLQDYPVFVRTVGDGLLVLGYPKGSYAKLTGNYYPVSALRKLPLFAAVMLGLDLLGLFLACILSRRQILQSTGPIIGGIQALAEGKPVALRACGELSEIADSIERASGILQRQRVTRADWIAGVSHDIRTPLSMVLGYAGQIAADPEASPAIREKAGRIQAHSVKIKELIQNLNLVSRLEYDDSPLEKSPVRLSRLIRSYAAGLLNAGIPDGFSLEVAIPPEAKGLTVEGDPQLLSRAVDNLVRNSIQHNPQGCRVRIGLTAAEGGARITVEDDGVGIAPEEAARQPSSVRAEDGNGHGLGLRIVRQIIQAHGGALTVESSPGNGVRATLSL